MSGMFSSYGIASNALAAFQAALDVTGNNIANVNTDGYTRQSIDLTQNGALSQYGIHPYEIGTGVSVSSVNRIRDSLLDTSMNNAQGDLGKFSTLASALQSVQNSFPEPGANGISAALSKFFTAWSGLSSNPNDAGAKQAVQQAGGALAEKVRTTFGQLKDLNAGLQKQLTGSFDQVDHLTKEIADLNNQIAAKTATGAAPNALLDQRTKDLEKLSGLVSIQTFPNANGSVTVYSNSLALVDSGGATPIPRNVDPATGALTGASVTMQTPTGQIAGIIQAMQKVSGYQGKLDELANTLRSQVNALHMTGKNSLGKTGVMFFNDSTPPAPQTGAADFDISAAIKADPNAVASGVSGAAGDGGVALSLSHLTNAAIKGLGGSTITGFYTTLVGAIGSDSQTNLNAQSTQTAVVAQITNQRQAVSGVNIDEEMSNMLRYQRSYQAAAKALSVFDTATQELIGIIK